MFGRRKQDSLKATAKARRKAEDETPWFMVEDDGPELDVEAGRSAAMDRRPRD
jgi:hypothetical protein